MITAVALFLKFIEYRTLFIFVGLCISVGLIGVGLFESTAIQFGMDQMLEASSDELSTFIHWYYWSCNVGKLLTVCFATGILIIYSDCVIKLDKNLQNATNLYNDLHPYYFTVTTIFFMIVLGLQLVCACVGLFLLIGFKKHFNIDRTGEHPLKLIYKVLRYAWKHKCPEHRSAFTYWEEDIPPRIDLGKSKYGGPFTTEEVEDTKTFFRIFILLLSLIGFYLSAHGYSIADQLMREQCPSIVVLAILGDPMQLAFLTVFLGVLLYQLIKHWYKLNGSLNMLKRMGLGLFCCFLKSVIEICVQVTMTGGRKCNHFDNNTRDSCYFLTFELNIDNTCTTISNATDNFFNCNQNDAPFLLLLIPYLLQGLSFLLVFMTALEFICAQAPLRLKGLLIGVWYAFLAINYLLIESSELYTIARTTWISFHSVKTFLILISLIVYVVWLAYEMKLSMNAICRRDIRQRAHSVLAMTLSVSYYSKNYSV